MILQCFSGNFVIPIAKEGFSVKSRAWKYNISDRLQGNLSTPLLIKHCAMSGALAPDKTVNQIKAGCSSTRSVYKSGECLCPVGHEGQMN